MPYSKEKYSETEELAELAEKKRLSRAEALIRWRWKRDKDGNLVCIVFGTMMRFAMVQESP